MAKASELNFESLFEDNLREKAINDYRKLYYRLMDQKDQRAQILTSIGKYQKKFAAMVKDVKAQEFVLKDQVEYINTLSSEIFQLLKNSFIDQTVANDFNLIKTVKSKPAKLESSGTNLLQIIEAFGKVYVDKMDERRKTIISTLDYRFTFLNSVYECLKDYGLHLGIVFRETHLYSFGILYKSPITQQMEFETDMFCSLDKIQKNYLTHYSNINNCITVKGKVINIKYSENYLISSPYTSDEAELFANKNGYSLKSKDGLSQFFKAFPNEFDNLKPKNIKDEPLNEEIKTNVIELKNLLITKRSKNAINKNTEYQRLISSIKQSEAVWLLMPDVLKGCHSYDEFSAKSKYWFERVSKIAEMFENATNFLEQGHSEILENVTVNVESLNFEHIQNQWKKCRDFLKKDPEDAITHARSFLESVLKQMLFEMNIKYDNNGDLNKLYKLVSKELQLSPNGNYEQPFKEVTSGLVSVVNGVSAIRNNLSSSHGKDEIQSKDIPLNIHAELVVNSVGIISIFLIQSYKNK